MSSAATPWRLPVMAMAVALVAAACSPMASESSSTLTPSTGGPTTTSAPEVPMIDVPVGVIWEEANVEMPEGEARVWDVARGPSGFVAVGTAVVQGPWPHRTPVVWHSPDGLTWTLADLPAGLSEGDRLGIHVTAGAIGFVVAGALLDGCSDEEKQRVIDPVECPRGSVFTAFSPDGVAWTEGSTADGSFGSGVSVEVTDIHWSEGHFLAVGVNKGDGPDWTLDVWTSDDGVGWERSHRFDDVWPAYLEPRFHEAGGNLALTTWVELCGEVVQGERGEWAPRRQRRHPFDPRGTVVGRLWVTSDAGVSWTQVDFVELGIVDLEPAPEECLAYYPETGLATFSGGDLWWFRNHLAWKSADGEVWMPADPEERDMWPANIAPPVDFALHTVDPQSLDEDWLQTAPGVGFFLWRQAGSDAEQLIHRPHIFATAEGDIAVHQYLRTAWSSSSASDEWVSWDRYASDLFFVGEQADEVGILIEGDLGLAFGIDGYSTPAHPVIFWSRPASVPEIPGSCDLGPGADCRFAVLDDADLAGADLRGVNLESASLRGVSLRGADLTGANLDLADLSGADLTDAVVDRASMRGVILGRNGDVGPRLDRLSAREADLRWARISEATGDGIDFSGADLRGAEGGIPLTTATSLIDATVERTRFECQGDEPLDLSGRSLAGSYLEGCDGADLSGADLRRVRVNGNFSAADFSGADLRQARFGAWLVGADFRSANLAGAEFGFAILSDALFAGAVIHEVVWVLNQTICPDGTEFVVPEFSSVGPLPTDSCEGHFIDR